jgi:hypothetical protein
VQKHPTFYAAEVATPPVLIAFDLLSVKGRDVSRPRSSIAGWPLSWLPSQRRGLRGDSGDYPL